MPQAVDRGEPFEIEIDGELVIAFPGETIAAAALAAGIATLRRSATGSPRGIFCGMGLCQECRMVVDGRPNVRACVTAAVPGLRARTQEDLGPARI